MQELSFKFRSTKLCSEDSFSCAGIFPTVHKSWYTEKLILVWNTMVNEGGFTTLGYPQAIPRDMGHCGFWIACTLWHRLGRSVVCPAALQNGASKSTSTCQVEQPHGPWPLPEVKSFLTPLGSSPKLIAYLLLGHWSSRFFLAVIRKSQITSRQLVSGYGRTVDSAHQPFWEPAQSSAEKLCFS